MLTCRTCTLLCVMLLVAAPHHHQHLGQAGTTLSNLRRKVVQTPILDSKELGVRRRRRWAGKVIVPLDLHSHSSIRPWTGSPGIRRWATARNKDSPGQGLTVNRCMTQELLVPPRLNRPTPKARVGRVCEVACRDRMSRARLRSRSWTGRRRRRRHRRALQSCWEHSSAAPRHLSLALNLSPHRQCNLRWRWHSFVVPRSHPRLQASSQHGEGSSSSKCRGLQWVAPLVPTTQRLERKQAPWEEHRSRASGLRRNKVRLQRKQLASSVPEYRSLSTIRSRSLKATARSMVTECLSRRRIM